MKILFLMLQMADEGKGGGMYEDLKDLLGCEVDLITVGGLLPFAKESADRDKILIYERTEQRS